MSQSTEFNFTGLADIYRSAIQNDRTTIVFEVKDGVGCFVFMMFFSDEDDSRDRLFILLARTNVLISLKMYGSHRNGDFKVYISAKEEILIRSELDIKPGLTPFSITDALKRINGAIPDELSIQDTIETMRKHRKYFDAHTDLRSKVEEAKKIFLIGPRRLAAGAKPQEKTLRKLYLYVNADPRVISEFIDALKMANRTVAWTDKPSNIDINLRQMINDIAADC